MAMRMFNSHHRRDASPPPTVHKYDSEQDCPEPSKSSPCYTPVSHLGHCTPTTVSTRFNSLHISDITGTVTIGTWHLSRHNLLPNTGLDTKICDYLAAFEKDDLLLECRFQGYYSEESTIHIHRSRLEYAGGRLAELVPAGYSCNNRVICKLTDKDTPTSFKFIRRFLYCQVLDFSELDAEGLLDLAFACHRWGLQYLFHAVLLYLEHYNLLVGGKILLYAAYLLKLEWVSQRFRRVFCTQLCVEIDSIISILINGGDKHAKGSCLLALAGEDWLWKTVCSEGIFSYIVQRLSYEMRIKHQAYLVYIVMRYMEPMIDDDDIIINLLLKLGWNDSDAGAGVFSNVKWISTWSARALRLCAIAMRSPVTHGISLTIPIRLQVSDLKGSDRFIVRSSRYSVGSTVFYLSCSQSTIGDSDSECDGYSKYRSQGLSLYVHVEKQAGEHVENDMQSGFSKVKVWARVTNDGCRCGLDVCGGKSWHGLLKEMRNEFSLEKAVIGGTHHGWNNFLGASDIENWRSLHENCCSFTITAAIELVQAH